MSATTNKVSIHSNKFNAWLGKNTYRLSYDTFNPDEQRGRVCLHNADKREFIEAYFWIFDEEEYWD